MPGNFCLFFPFTYFVFVLMFFKGWPMIADPPRKKRIRKTRILKRLKWLIKKNCQQTKKLKNNNSYFYFNSIIIIIIICLNRTRLPNDTKNSFIRYFFNYFFKCSSIYRFFFFNLKTCLKTETF